MLPFLKWPGGKRWLVERYPDLLPTKYGTYIEPFLGSGAVYFHLEPRKAILSDANEELIAAYEAIRSDPDVVRRHLRKHNREHNRDYYYAQRDNAPRTATTRAAQFVYLNRTCFNGIYRVNLNGVFNVPIGTKTGVVLGSST